jgi:uncharacterized protein (TIGR04562 family)
MINQNDTINTYDFPWQPLEVVLGEKSLQELRGLSIHSAEAANSFMQACGMNPVNLSHAKQCDAFFAESLKFIRSVLFTDAEKNLLQCPKEILNSDDPRYILLYASDKQPRNRYLRHWSCSVLKVMQAILALEFSDKLSMVPKARENIFSSIRKMIVNHTESTTQENCWESSILQGSQGSAKPLLIERIEWKETKTRQSILLKLLHKPEVMMEEVFDFLGARFVLYHESQIPRLLEILIDNKIVLPHMVMSSRSRNSILKITRAQNLVNEVRTWNSMGILNPQEYENMIHSIPWSEPSQQSKHQNNFSSDKYKSLQFTVRYPVRIQNPAHTLVDELVRQLYNSNDLKIVSNEANLFMKNIVPQEIVSYFPFEFQILDKKSYDQSLYGAASHERYKQSQLEAIRKRVLGGLLSWTFEKLKTQNSFRG